MRRRHAQNKPWLVINMQCPYCAHRWVMVTHQDHADEPCRCDRCGITPDPIEKPIVSTQIAPVARMA